MTIRLHSSRLTVDSASFQIFSRLLVGFRDRACAWSYVKSWFLVFFNIEGWWWHILSVKAKKDSVSALYLKLPGCLLVANYIPARRTRLGRHYLTFGTRYPHNIHIHSVVTPPDSLKDRESISESSVHTEKLPPKPYFLLVVSGVTSSSAGLKSAGTR